MDNFQSLKIHHHPKVGYRKNLSRMRTLRKKKNCGRTKAKGNGRERKKKKENVDMKLRQKHPKNLNELRSQKWTKRTEKKCRLCSNT